VPFVKLNLLRDIPFPQRWSVLWIPIMIPNGFWRLIDVWYNVPLRWKIPIFVWWIMYELLMNIMQYTSWTLLGKNNSKTYIHNINSEIRWILQKQFIMNCLTSKVIFGHHNKYSPSFQYLRHSVRLNININTSQSYVDTEMLFNPDEPFVWSVFMFSRKENVIYVADTSKAIDDPPIKNEIGTRMHSFPLILLWCIYQNVNS
jgi:hypothetical protein